MPCEKLAGCKDLHASECYSIRICTLPFWLNTTSGPNVMVNSFTLALPFINDLIGGITMCYKRNIMLNSVRQHYCFVTQSNYIGYMFRLLISHLEAYFNRFSHKMLCTHWDPSVFTSMEYIKHKVFMYSIDVNNTWNT